MATLNEQTDLMEEADGAKDLYLTFLVRDQEYGVEIRHVTEIVGLQVITDIPNVPHYVRGVINLRGTVIPVVDVRLRFGLEPRDYDDRTCVIVVSFDEEVVGIVVDRVSEVVTVPPEDIDPPSAVIQGVQDHYILGLGKIGEAVKVLLDVEALLGDVLARAA